MFALLVAPDASEERRAFGLNFHNSQRAPITPTGGIIALTHVTLEIQLYGLATLEIPPALPRLSRWRYSSTGRVASEIQLGRKLIGHTPSVHAGAEYTDVGLLELRSNQRGWRRPTPGLER